jgi:hypothetical protein
VCSLCIEGTDISTFKAKSSLEQPTLAATVGAAEVILVVFLDPPLMSDNTPDPVSVRVVESLQVSSSLRAAGLFHAADLRHDL